MKNLVLVLLFLAISISLSEDSSPEEDTPSCGREPMGDGDTLETCKTLTPDGGKYCCLLSLEFNGDGFKSCISITDEEYENRNIYITNYLKGVEEEEEKPKNLRANIYCDGDTNLPEDEGGNGEDPVDESITCLEIPDGERFDDELNDCKKLTPAKGNYCCLLSYDNGKDKGDICISINKDEYADRNIALTKLKNIEGFENAKGEIICDGDKTDDAGFTVLKLTKGFLGLLLIFL